MFIIRVDFRGRGVRYGTVEEANLFVRFRILLKRTGRTLGGLFTEVKEHGQDKSQVHIQFRSDVIRNDEGTKGLYPGNTSDFKLLERHKHIRRLTEGDLSDMRSFDAQIERELEILRGLRAQRAEFMKGAWRRAEKIQINELEDRAKEGSS